MSRIHLRSNTLVLWLSLSAAIAAAALGVGCSSSDSDGGGAAAGASGGGKPGKAGSSGAGDAPAGDAGDDTSGGGTEAGGTGGTEAGGAETGGAPVGAAGEAGAAGSGQVEDPDAEAKARAVALINGLEVIRRCTSCHQNDYSGLGFWPNITPDETNGIGTWTADQIKAAIRDGVNAAGETLCGTMERYKFTDPQLDDVVLYLQSLAPKSMKITQKCPG